MAYTVLKQRSFTAVSGEGYFVNTTSGAAVTVTLPASPSVQEILFSSISDYASILFQTNKNLTIARNGSDNINGSCNNANTFYKR